jgi:hypothetical protein
VAPVTALFEEVVFDEFGDAILEFGLGEGGVDAVEGGVGAEEFVVDAAVGDLEEFGGDLEAFEADFFGGVEFYIVEGVVFVDLERLYSFGDFVSALEGAEPFGDVVGSGDVDELGLDFGAVEIGGVGGEGDGGFGEEEHAVVEEDGAEGLAGGVEEGEEFAGEFGVFIEGGEAFGSDADVGVEGGADDEGVGGMEVEGGAGEEVVGIFGAAFFEKVGEEGLGLFVEHVVIGVDVHGVNGGPEDIQWDSLVRAPGNLLRRLPGEMVPGGGGGVNGAWRGFRLCAECGFGERYDEDED